MKLIPQTVELLKQEDWKKQIELAARTCYKSEDKIGEGTADAMLKKLINYRHYSMLEHGTIYLHMPIGDTGRSNKLTRFFHKYYHNPYSRAKMDYTGSNVYITTNYRVLLENGWTKDLQYLCKPTDNHVKRYTFRLITSISIVRELIRHRAFSFANESTRFIDYNKKGEFYFIKPYWYEESDKDVKNRFDYICNAAIAAYNFMLQHNYSPQQAREVLPLCTKSELIMTGFEDDWENFLDIRLRGTTGKPHPDMVELAQLIEDEIKKEE